MRKSTGRHLGEEFPCSICGETFIMEHACQHVCKKKECKKKLHQKNVDDYKQTKKYKEYNSAYGKVWYKNGGKEWLKKWRDRNRDKLNERQRKLRYNRPINKAGARTTALELGYKSMFEVAGAEDMSQRGIDYIYEPEQLEYQLDPQKYTPDYRVFRKDGSSFLVELKGFFRSSDKLKLRCIKQQHPDLDLRIVFQNARKPSYKGAKTTYADWAEKNGFRWAEGTIPEEWLKEK